MWNKQKENIDFNFIQGQEGLGVPHLPIEIPHLAGRRLKWPTSVWHGGTWHAVARSGTWWHAVLSEAAVSKGGLACLLVYCKPAVLDANLCLFSAWSFIFSLVPLLVGSHCLRQGIRLLSASWKPELPAGKSMPGSREILFIFSEIIWMLLSETSDGDGVL